MMDSHAAKTPGGVAEKRQPTWDDLRIFAVLASTASIRAAAAKLTLNPSTVSRRLSALEDALGVRLFERQPEGLKLTQAGHEAQHLAEQMGGQVQALQRRLSGQDQSLDGTVRVTTAEGSAGVAAEALASLRQQYPELVIELIVSDQMLNLARHEAEVALRIADSPPQELVGRRVGHAAVAIYGARKYLERQSSNLPLAEHDWVEWPEYARHKPAFQWIEKNHPNRRRAVSTNSSGAVRIALQSGLGIAPLSCIQAASDPTLVRLERLPETCSTPVWLLTHPDMRNTPRVRVVMDYLAEQLVTRRAWLTGEH